MIFVVITFLAALLIEGLGTLVSVIGLSTLFGSNPIIIALAIALDIGKLVVVSLLYTYWQKLNKLMKTYALLAAVVTMTITSAGAAGYLAGEFQKAIVGTQEVSLKVSVLKEEQAKLEARKKQIDDQIANLPSNYSRSRIALMRQFEDEQKQITARLNQISQELPAAQLTQIGVEAKAGPILYISKAFGITVEEAVKWVILMIIFVFDPLAVFLIIAGNFLLHQRRVHKEVKASQVDLFEERSLPPNRVDDALPEEWSPVDEAQEVKQPIYEELQPTSPPEPKKEATRASKKKITSQAPSPVAQPEPQPSQVVQENNAPPPVISVLTDVVPDKDTVVDSTNGTREDTNVRKIYPHRK
jgi:hypothetical protein